MPYQTIHEEFQIKWPHKYVEFRLSHEKSIDSLYREGFREPFQAHWLTCLLERWDHLDGRYKLVLYKGGGLYMCADVSDPQWKEIIDLVYSENEPPIPLVSENWFELEIIHPRGQAPLGGISIRQLTSDEIPTTHAEWEEFVRGYEVKQGRTTFCLRNGRTGGTVFSNKILKNRVGSVRIVGGKQTNRAR